MKHSAVRADICITSTKKVRPRAVLAASASVVFAAAGAPDSGHGSICAAEDEALERRTRGRRRLSAARLPDSAARLSKAKETWDEWWPELGPSRELLDHFHGKGDSGAPLAWDDYVRRYLDEMSGPQAVWRLRALAQRLAGGDTITLLCSSACHDPARCHRTILAGLLTQLPRAKARALP